MYSVNEGVRAEFIGQVNAKHRHHRIIEDSRWLAEFIRCCISHRLPHDRLFLCFNLVRGTFDLCWWINKPGVESGVPSHRIIHRMEYHPDIDPVSDSIRVALHIYASEIRRTPGVASRASIRDEKMHRAIADSDEERRDRIRTYAKTGKYALAEMYRRMPMPYAGKAEREIAAEAAGR